MKDETLVMIPGPTPVVDSIRVQMGRAIQAFGDPRFVSSYRGLIDDLGTLFNCTGKTFAIAGTGTLAMEMAIANSTKRGDHVLIVSHGFFGDRFIDICERKGLNVDVVSCEWGNIVPVEQIEAKLKQKSYAIVTVTHVDTSTAVCAPIEQIGQIVKAFPNTLYLVDGVAATAGEFADVEAMNIDIMITASQKAFGVCPGMFVLWASKKAMDRRAELGVIPEYYVDFDRWVPIMDDPAKYFATPPINLVWAMAESVQLIKQEGLQQRCLRHAQNARALHSAFEELGLQILAEKEHRAVTLSCLIYPQGISDTQFRAAMLDEGVIVAGALASYAGKAFRVGHMGNININDMVLMLGAIERSLKRCGLNVQPGSGVGAYINALEGC